MKKILAIALALIIVISVIIYNIFKIKSYDANMYYMDTYIYAKVYSRNEKEAHEALKGIESIYKEYHNLANRYENNDNKNNIYYINNNVSKDKYLEIDEKLYNLIEYGIKCHKDSKGKVDISMGNVIDVWKGYREAGITVPELDELKSVNNGSIKKIELKDGKIKNNNLNLDLGAITKGVATEEVKKYLKEHNIDKYIINAGGNVVVGKKYSKEKYKVGLEDPTNPSNIYKVLKIENKAIVTSGNYQRYYDKDGVRYNHIIDPDTLFPAQNMKSVTVIADDSKYADFLSTYLFLISVEEGQKIVEKDKNIDAIWYTNDNQIITSSGIKNYE